MLLLKRSDKLKHEGIEQVKTQELALNQSCYNDGTARNCNHLLHSAQNL
jgi:hypothetical protein